MCRKKAICFYTFVCYSTGEHPGKIKRAALGEEAMKSHGRNPFLLALMVAGLGSVLAGQSSAQSFRVVHDFAGPSGAYPFSGLISSGNTLYGTTRNGGGGDGTVFAVNTDGSGLQILRSFSSADRTNGVEVSGGLISSGDKLYATTEFGGAHSAGIIFKLNTNGDAFTNLYSLAFMPIPSYTNSDGAWPYAGLTLLGNTLYGTASHGGGSGNGTVFAINTDGSDFTVLHTFTATASDGSGPFGGLILSGNTLYGTTANGGSSGNGTVFAVNTDGTAFTNLYSFTGGSDGANPPGALTLSGGTLYGTANSGGSSSNGTVFAINIDGTEFRTVHSFSSLSTDSSGNYVNSDGAHPIADLLLLGNNLYGTATSGGAYGSGTIFAVSTDGTGFSTVHNFAVSNNISCGLDCYISTNSDGSGPRGSLTFLGNALYGTAAYGGQAGLGTVFSLLVPPQLSISRDDANVALSWPTNFTGFTLQSTTDLTSALWTTNLSAPVVVNGWNTVTDRITGTQQFYRLIQ